LTGAAKVVEEWAFKLALLVVADGGFVAQTMEEAGKLPVNPEYCRKVEEFLQHTTFKPKWEKWYYENCKLKMLPDGVTRVPEFEVVYSSMIFLFTEKFGVEAFEKKFDS
jgi:hypothetical protein